MIKRTFIEVLIIVLVSVFASLAAYQLRPDGIPFISAGKKVEGDENTEIQKEISLEDAIAMFKTEKVLFVDSRSPDDYSTGHIKGAVNIPDFEFDEMIEDFFSKATLETPIITYCDGDPCDLAKSVAEKLNFAGYENTSYITNGWTRWREQSLPVVFED